MELNGNAKKVGLGGAVLTILGVLGIGASEATDTTNFLGGLSKEQVLEICASHDDLRPVEELAKNAWQLAGDNALDRINGQIASLRAQVKIAESQGRTGEARELERIIRQLEEEARRIRSGA